MNGLLVLDKPAGITSRDAVDRAIGWFGRGIKIGHTGTLDPFATGVLVLCLGSATRLTEYVQRMSKTYRATFLLGSTSDTDDIDGLITPTANATDPGREAVAATLAAFVGTIEQTPPNYSAAKVGGQRAYALARKGAGVALQARPVTIHAIDLLSYQWPAVDVEVRCGKGTYIRSLARDVGSSLRCGAYVSALRRTSVGPFTAEDGLKLDEDRETARSHLLPVAMALAELPGLVVTADDARRLRQGQAIALPGSVSDEGEAGLFDEAGELVGVGLIDRERGQVRPAKILS
jgi:tRNA pseudouridine55 synthase